jgi:hypothetical protein
MEVKMTEKGELASLSPQAVDQVVSALISRLGLQNLGNLLPKQGVVGSNPITRSTFIQLQIVHKSSQKNCLPVAYP